MILRAKICSILCLLVIACLIGGADARAQSRGDAQKRSFADLLARRVKSSRAESQRAINTASRTARSTSAGRSAQVPNRSASSTPMLFGGAAPFVANATGVPSATPLTPSGFGVHKDTYVESLYQDILGRNPTQSELDYWSRQLARGVPANVVARLIFDSQEHQTAIRNGTAPGIPLGKAYRDAYEAAHPGQRVPI